MRKFIVGSRRSGLAMTQSRQFIDSLKSHYPEMDIEIKEIVTKGDRIVDVQLSKVASCPTTKSTSRICLQAVSWVQAA